MCINCVAIRNIVRQIKYRQRENWRQKLYHSEATTHAHDQYLCTWRFSDRASWIDYILITNLMHWLFLFIKYYFPPHVSSLKCSSSGGYSCIHAVYGTVTLYDSSWWPVGTQLEWELTAGGRLLVGACSLRYLVFNAHAPYCCLWPVQFYIIFPCCLINGTIFEKKLLDIQCVLWFSLQLLSEAFLIIRINTHSLSLSLCLSQTM